MKYKSIFLIGIIPFLPLYSCSVNYDEWGDICYFEIFNENNVLYDANDNIKLKFNDSSASQQELRIIAHLNYNSINKFSFFPLEGECAKYLNRTKQVVNKNALTISTTINFNNNASELSWTTSNFNFGGTIDDCNYTVTNTITILNHTIFNPIPFESIANNNDGDILGLTHDVLDDYTLLMIYKDFNGIASHAFDVENIDEVDDITHILPVNISGIIPDANYSDSTDILFIGESAFQSLSSLFSIDVPLSVSHIFKKAFYECDNLSYINIPQIQFIDPLAFGLNKNLYMDGFIFDDDLNQKKLPTCGYTWYNQTNENGVIVGKALYDNNWNPLYDPIDKTKATNPYPGGTYDDGSTYSYSLIGSIGIGKIKIGGADGIFGHYSTSSEYDGIEKILSYSTTFDSETDNPYTKSVGAFEGAASLTDVILSEEIVDVIGVTPDIDNNGFKDCANLTNLIISTTNGVGTGSIVPLHATGSNDSGWLSGCTSLKNIYVPNSLISAYNASTEWTNFITKNQINLLDINTYSGF